MEYKRSKRVACDLKIQLSNIILKEIKDPLIGFVTITDVIVSDDLKVAKVYFSALGDNIEKQKSYKGLLRAKKFLRRELSSRIRLKNVPELHFFIDNTFDEVSKIDDLLKKAKS